MICSIEGCNKPAKGRGWCGMHYDRWRQYGDPSMVRTPMRQGPLRHRATTQLETPCREWWGRHDSYGYGLIDRQGRGYPTHKWIWEQINGPVPNGMVVMHRCDNPPCYRYDHLVLGTKAQNSNDMMSKSRGRSQFPPGNHPARWQRMGAAVVIVLIACVTGPLLREETPANAAPAALPVEQRAEINDTLRALAALQRLEYRWTTDAGALKAIRAWQRANGLVVDGVVGPITLASLNLPATASAPAVRVTPNPQQTPAPASDVESIIRAVWPDELEDRAVAIAMRESRLVPEVINRNRDATGLFQIMWSVHRVWLCPQLGICAQSQLQDAETNTRAAYALYRRDGGWRPWSL